MLDKTNDEATPRKPYSKPELRQVALRPEEAVLGACKSNKISGPGNPTCRTPACYAEGS